MLRKLAATLALAALAAPLGCGSGAQPPRAPEPPLVGPAPTPAPAPGLAIAASPGLALEHGRAVKPKPLGDAVRKGLAWLARAQFQSGGWGQGDEPTNIRLGEPQVGVANVADTSMALLAFLRAGYTPAAGEYRDAVDRGLGFVMGKIEASDDASLSVTDVNGTRVQAKIGPYIDTFAALMVLTEAKGRMRDPAGNARLDAALKKVVRKIEKNQRDNGSWDDRGWAPVLSQAIAAKGLNRAVQAGASVSRVVLKKVEEQAVSGEMSARGSAGVVLYGDAARSANLRDDAETKKARAKQLRARAKQKPSPMAQSPDVPSAAELAAADADADAATRAAMDNERQLARRLTDPQFIAGFGNNGGEEFLSYLLISETLVQEGGQEWARWDTEISKLIDRVQNEDGSWTGHHCITGRTFCTAAALLVLLGDRTPATMNVIAK